MPGILSRTLRLTNYHTDHINHAPSLFGTWVNFLRLSLTPLLYIFCIYLLPLPLTHRPILPFQKPRSHNEITYHPTWTSYDNTGNGRSPVTCKWKWVKGKVTHPFLSARHSPWNLVYQFHFWQGFIYLPREEFSKTGQC